MVNDPNSNPAKLDLKRWPDRTTVLVIRYLGFGACLAFTSLFKTGHSSFLHAFLALLCVLCVPYALWLARQAAGRRLVLHQFVLDHLLLFFLISRTGGAASPYWLLYPAAVLSAGVIHAPVKAMLAGLVSALAYGLSVWAFMESLPAPTPWLTLVERGFLILLFGLLSSGLVSWCRLKESGVDLGMIGHHMLQRVQVGILVLNEEDMVIQANPAACRLLGADERQVIGHNFNAYRADDTSMEPRTLLRTEALHLKRADGEEFPAFYKKADLELPPELGTELELMGVGRPRIVSFVDVTEALQATSELFKAEHLEIVDNLLNTMADGIRNPVTGITSAIQVLKKIEDKASTGKSGEYEAQRREMFDHILHEANRLDKIIEYVIIHPHITPAKFRELFDNLRRSSEADDGNSSFRA